MPSTACVSTSVLARKEARAGFLELEHFIVGEALLTHATSSVALVRDARLVKFQFLPCGLRLLSDRGWVATVDASKHRLDIRPHVGPPCVFAASDAGLDAAVELLATLHALSTSCPITREQVLQPDLFSVSLDAPLFRSDGVRRADGVRGTRGGGFDRFDHCGPLRRELVGALRRAARRVVPSIDAVEAAVDPEGCTPLLFSSAVLGTRHLVDDILRFRPAAIACAMVESLRADTESLLGVAALGERLASWRGLYSPTQVSSRALNKTLAECAPDIDAWTLWSLRRVHLVRPVQSALHLRVLAERAACGAQHRRAHLELIQHAGEGELADVMARAATALRLHGFDPGESERCFAEFLATAGPAPARGGLPGLVRRAIRDVAAQDRAEGLSLAAAVALPPIALPELRGVRFLRTVDEVITEGEHMHHCIGSLVRDAFVGDAFVFHVDHNHEAASVHVDADGVVVDAKGPFNVDNNATEHARRTLGAWGAGILCARAAREPADDGTSALTSLSA